MFVCLLTDSRSARRAQTHGRRVRHSSSDSSDSDYSGGGSGGGSSSLHSRSSSPEVHPDPASPASQPRNYKEVPGVSAVYVLRLCLVRLPPPVSVFF